MRSATTLRGSYTNCAITDDLLIQSVGEVVAVHTDYHAVGPRDGTRSDMKDAAAECIAVDLLANLWR